MRRWPTATIRGRAICCAISNGRATSRFPAGGSRAGTPVARARSGCFRIASIACRAGRWSSRRYAAPAVRDYIQRVFLPDYADWIELEAEWQMSQDTHPEATYLAFPFALPGATARFDAGGQAVIPEADQLPGVCRDYFTVQNWADFNDGERGVTIAMPENPLIQLGGFHFGHNEYHFDLERALLVGWVTNNYWETNFRAHQPGMVYARYRILPYNGAFDQARAHRFGLEAAHAPAGQPLAGAGRRRRGAAPCGDAASPARAAGAGREHPSRRRRGPPALPAERLGRAATSDHRLRPADPRRGLALRPDGEPAGSPARPHREGDPGATPTAGRRNQAGVKPGVPARSAHSCAPAASALYEQDRR